MGRANTLGQLLYDEIASEFVIDESGWTTDMVGPISARLQAQRPPEERLEVVVPWLPGYDAFTAPGRYVFISRRLLERCGSDEVAAFILAHEIAHHELGHLRVGWPAVAPLSLLMHRLRRIRHSQRQELEADRRAIELCVMAGYDAERCLEAYRLLSSILLDYRDDIGVFGALPGADKARRTHPPLLEREAVTRRHLRQWLVARHHSAGRDGNGCALNCSECNRGAATRCAHCSRGLCTAHARRTPRRCPRCCASPEPLCQTCVRSSRCLPWTMAAVAAAVLAASIWLTW